MGSPHSQLRLRRAAGVVIRSADRGRAPAVWGAPLWVGREAEGWPRASLPARGWGSRGDRRQARHGDDT